MQVRQLDFEGAITNRSRVLKAIGLQLAQGVLTSAMGRWSKASNNPHS